MEVRKCRNWAELPPELISAILVRLGTIDILENAQKVCRSWRRVCKDTSMWRKINMKNKGFKYHNQNLEIMCRHAVDRSQGGLVKIKLGWWIGSDDLLNYIANSSGNLKSLSFVGLGRITEQVFVAAIVKLPLLEEVEMQNCLFSSESLRVLGHSCPNMKTLKVRIYRVYQNKNDDYAVAIAETMPGLRHLQLIGNGLSNTGLNLILDNCPNLEHLDIRMCPYVKLVGDLEKWCFERIKVVKHCVL